ncbi:hypothetical protein Dimus_032402 [Dionaea muscipula]
MVDLLAKPAATPTEGMVKQPQQRNLKSIFQCDGFADFIRGGTGNVEVSVVRDRWIVLNSSPRVSEPFSLLES